MSLLLIGVDHLEGHRMLINAAMILSVAERAMVQSSTVKPEA